MENNVKPVWVTLISSSRTDDAEQEQPIRMRCQGQLRETSGGFMLRYQEIQTDDATGQSQTQDVILSLQPGRVTMNRLGPFGTTMVFVKDRRFEGAYRTPYGDLELALFATQVTCQAGPESGYVHLEYQLDMQGSYAAVQTIDVTYTTEGALPC